MLVAKMLTRSTTLPYSYHHFVRHSSRGECGWCPKGGWGIRKSYPHLVLGLNTGAYKATDIKVLEAKSGVTPLDIHLDQAVLRARDAPRSNEVMRLETSESWNTKKAAREKREKTLARSNPDVNKRHMDQGQYGRSRQRAPKNVARKLGRSLA